jgi:peptidoglycan/LPS O-acetylase OafA/YrhL
MQRDSDTRLRQLDSLRGIAALLVVFNHYFQTIPEKIRLGASVNDLWILSTWESFSTWLRFSPLRILVNGQAAVDIFFVLSGFVLAIPLTKNYQPSYWSFTIKRFCRIYIPFAVVLMVVATAYTIIPTDHSSTASRWMNETWAAVKQAYLLPHLLMTGNLQDMALDPVMWTLVHEMRIALILPLLFFLIRKRGALQTVGACLIISVLFSLRMSSIGGSWLSTFHFLWMFAAGSALAFYRAPLAQYSNHGALTRGFFWLLALALLIIPFDRVWADFLIGTGACLTIFLCLPKCEITRLLVSPIPLWLGRVSYSLYLIHLPILIIAMTANLGISNLASAFLLTFVATLISAEVTFRTVESPSHRLGIWLSRQITSRSFGPRLLDNDLPGSAI